MSKVVEVYCCCSCCGYVGKTVNHFGVDPHAQQGRTVAIAIQVIITERSYTSARERKQGLLVRGKAGGWIGTGL